MWFFFHRDPPSWRAALPASPGEEGCSFWSFRRPISLAHLSPFSVRVIDRGRLHGFADEVLKMLFGCGFHHQFEDAPSVQSKAVSVSPYPASGSQVVLSPLDDNMSVSNSKMIDYVTVINEEIFIQLKKPSCINLVLIIFFKSN